MEIKYLGHSSFRIKSKNGTAVVTDPYDKTMVGLSFPKTDASIVTISHDHNDHNQEQLVEGRNLVIRGPGAYESQEIKVYGYRTFHDNSEGSERGGNTMYLFVVDDVRILHAGDLGHELKDAVIDEFDEVDILLIPVGGFYTIDAETAVKVVRDIEPKIVIPMHFKAPGMAAGFDKLTGVDAFLKELDKTAAPQPKLVITKENLPKELEVVVLEYKK